MAIMFVYGNHECVAVAASWGWVLMGGALVSRPADLEHDEQPDRRRGVTFVVFLLFDHRLVPDTPADTGPSPRASDHRAFDDFSKGT